MGAPRGHGRDVTDSSGDITGERRYEFGRDVIGERRLTP
jgi:hypothetical protein